MTIPDILVLGAGSNSLVTACYLAKAGLSVSVFEKNAQPGGGVVSVETAPGFIQDTHAMGYMTCLANPALRNNELELETRFGLEWAYCEAPFASIFHFMKVLIPGPAASRSAFSTARSSRSKPTPGLPVTASAARWGRSICRLMRRASVLVSRSLART